MIKAKGVLISLILSMSIALSGCGGGSSETGTNSGTKTIKIANYTGLDHPLNVSLNEKFKPLVEKNSNGSLKVEIYSDSKLGSEQEYLTGTKSGTIEMAVTGGIMSDQIPQVDVLQLPFLFNDIYEAKKVLDSSVGKEMVNGFEEKLGLKFLGYSASGFRIFTSNKPLKKVEDINGLKLRMFSGYPVAIRAGQALGANVTPLPFSELFTALEEGVVDAQENPSTTIIASKLYEVQKYVLETRHIFSADMFSMNKRFWDGLTSEQQKVIEEAMKVTIDYEWELMGKAENENKEFLKEKGLEIIVPDQEFKDALRSGVQPVYDWYYQKNSWAKDLVEKIKTEAEK